MPTYQYECAACGYSFEILQRMTDARLVKCPQCSRKKLNRLIGSGSGIIFKGSGFYETDYKQKSSKASEPAAACPAASEKSDACKTCPHTAGARGDSE